ncbi:MAG: RsmE family RNA methyltransferase [Nibricoccus sp.]
MNIVLFEPEEIAAPLPRTDPRAIHILEVLRRQKDDTFDAGLINGPRGKATLVEISSTTLGLAFAWGEPTHPLPPITLLIGLPRPQTARKILQEATALGVGELHFVTTERGETSYANSTLWTSGEWRRHLIAGTAQAFCTRLPKITHGRDIAGLLPNLPPDAMRIALDNYEASTDLASALKGCAAKPVILAVGSERGWAPAERTTFRENRFALAHLGPRVLRTETAVVAALAIVRSTLGWL